MFTRPPFIVIRMVDCECVESDRDHGHVLPQPEIQCLSSYRSRQSVPEGTEDAVPVERDEEEEQSPDTELPEEDVRTRYLGRRRLRYIRCRVH